MELGFATTIRWTRLYKVQLNASVCGFFYNKRFSIICFHCQIVRSDEFPDSKFYTLEAGSYLISKDIRETTKFRENLQFSASCILSWLPGFKCSCFFNGLTPFQICCTWPLMFPHLALKKRRYGTHEILVLECLVLLVYPELTHRAALLLAMPSAPSSSLSSSVLLGPVLVFAPPLPAGLSSTPSLLPASWIRPTARLRLWPQSRALRPFMLGLYRLLSLFLPVFYSH